MILDNREGYVRRCDMCGVEMDFRHAEGCTGNDSPRYLCQCGATDRYTHELCDIQDAWKELFIITDTGQRRRMSLPRDFPADTCRDCAIKLTPYVIKFADLWLLDVFNNRLHRCINERKKAG